MSAAANSRTNEQIDPHQGGRGPAATSPGTGPSAATRWTGGWTRIDHVQLAMPVGAEDEARAYYVGALGFEELPKPPGLAARGGCWFEAGSVQLHLGGEAEFRPARKAHPAIVCVDLHAFATGYPGALRWDHEIEGVLRAHVDDPFGNRIELVQEPDQQTGR